MLRLTHSQTFLGPILVDDIDDGLPNKEVHRLTGDPKAYSRDGYANLPKQVCYIPYSRVSSGDTLAGWIDLNETDRVTFSNGRGKISKLEAAGIISVEQFSASEVAAPTLATAVLDTDLTLTGTALASVAPDTSVVYITCPKAFLIVTGATNGSIRYTAVASGTGGTAVQIEHVVSGNDTVLSVDVDENDITVNVATDGGGAATSTATQVAAAITGTPAAAALLTATALGTGGGVVGEQELTALAITEFTLTQAAILAGSGTISGTSIVIPAALIPGAAITVNKAQVRANSQLTSVVTFT